MKKVRQYVVTLSSWSLLWVPGIWFSSHGLDWKTKQSKTHTFKLLIYVFSCLKIALCSIHHTCTSIFSHGSNWMSRFPLGKVLVNHKIYKIPNTREIIEQATDPSATTDPSQALISLLFCTIFQPIFPGLVPVV